MPKTDHEKDVAAAQIEKDFTDFYRDNYPRFASMYDGQYTILGESLNYLDMLPAHTRNKIVTV